MYFAPLNLTTDSYVWRSENYLKLAYFNSHTVGTSWPTANKTLENYGLIVILFIILSNWLKEGCNASLV